MEFMIANRGTCAVLYAAPGLVIAGEVLLAAVRISQIADSNDRSRDFFQ